MEVNVENFINNLFVPVEDYIDSYDPAVGVPWAKLPNSNKSHVEQAYIAAKAAYPLWRNTPIAERSKLMLKAADILESRIDEFAAAESRDNGKPVSLAKAVDIPRAILNMRFFATAILHYINKSSQLDSLATVNYTTRSPLGVAGVISPWNLPLYLLTWKIAPCIATGNTCVCKPSEITSVTAYMFCQVLKDAGIPAGVVNMVFGLGPNVGEAIVVHPDIPLLTFTGSTATGVRIQQQSAPFCKKLSLELGGKNPCVVFADVDLDKSIPTIVRSCFANQGEICLCSERMFVQRPIFEEFVKRFVAATRELKVGDPTAQGITTGPLVSKEHLDKVRHYIDLAKQSGGKIECGHTVDELTLPEKNQKGYFFLPTVITGLTDDCNVNQEEIFGPVVSIAPFDTEEEVIARANGVKYGLSASIWCRDVSILHRVAQQVEAGTVWCNCWLVRDLRMPFGGTKMSGIGFESQDDSLEFFTEQKTISIKLDA